MTFEDVHFWHQWGKSIPQQNTLYGFADDMRQSAQFIEAELYTSVCKTIN